MALKSGAHVPGSCQLRRCTSWGEVLNVQDVRGLAIADLDAQRIHEDELVDAVSALHRDLRGEPAPEGKAHHCHPVVGQGPQDFQIEVDQVVDRLELRRAGWPKPGCEGAMISACRPSRSR
jgi:hypothetical protein